MNDLIGGRDYFLTYFQYPLLISISIAFVLWMVYLGITIANFDRDNHIIGDRRLLLFPEQPTNVLKYVFIPIFINLLFMIYGKFLQCLIYNAFTLFVLQFNRCL